MRHGRRAMGRGPGGDVTNQQQQPQEEDEPQVRVPQPRPPYHPQHPPQYHLPRGSDVLSHNPSESTYDFDRPVRCKKCNHLIVPVERRKQNFSSVVHCFLCWLCVWKNIFGMKDCNEDCKTIVLICPHCDSMFAAH